MCLSFSFQTPDSPPLQMETSVFRQTTLISANWMTQNAETKDVQSISIELMGPDTQQLHKRRH